MCEVLERRGKGEGWVKSCNVAYSEELLLKKCSKFPQFLKSFNQNKKFKKCFLHAWQWFTQFKQILSGIPWAPEANLIKTVVT